MTMSSTDNKNNGNGSSGGNRTFHPEAFSPGSALRPGHSSGDATLLINTNDKERDLLMKAEVINPDHALKAAMAIYYCDHNGLTDEKELVLNYLALLCAVGGKRADMLKQAIIGVLDDNSSRIRSWAGKRAAESNQKE